MLPSCQTTSCAFGRFYGRGGVRSCEEYVVKRALKNSISIELTRTTSFQGIYQTMRTEPAKLIWPAPYPHAVSTECISYSMFLFPIQRRYICCKLSSISSHGTMRGEG